MSSNSSENIELNELYETGNIIDKEREEVSSDLYVNTEVAPQANTSSDFEIEDTNDTSSDSENEFKLQKDNADQADPTTEHQAPRNAKSSDLELEDTNDTPCDSENEFKLQQDHADQADPTTGHKACNAKLSDLEIEDTNDAPLHLANEKNFPVQDHALQTTLIFTKNLQVGSSTLKFDSSLQVSDGNDVHTVGLYGSVVTFPFLNEILRERLYLGVDINTSSGNYSVTSGEMSFIGIDGNLRLLAFFRSEDDDKLHMVFVDSLLLVLPTSEARLRNGIHYFNPADKQAALCACKCAISIFPATHVLNFVEPPTARNKKSKLAKSQQWFKCGKFMPPI